MLRGTKCTCKFRLGIKTRRGCTVSLHSSPCQSSLFIAFILHYCSILAETVKGSEKRVKGGRERKREGKECCLLSFSPSRKTSILLLWQNAFSSLVPLRVGLPLLLDTGFVGEQFVSSSSFCDRGMKEKECVSDENSRDGSVLSFHLIPVTCLLQVSSV